MMLPGLMSRWTIPASWSASAAPATWRRMATTSETYPGPRAAAGVFSAPESSVAVRARASRSAAWPEPLSGTSDDRAAGRGQRLAPGRVVDVRRLSPGQLLADLGQVGAL